MECMDFYSDESLNNVLHRLWGYPGRAALIRYFASHASDINTALKSTILADISAYTDSGNPEVLPQLEVDIAGHTAELIRLFKGGRPGDFKFVREHAERRAAQRFPLEAMLHAYRCAHKIYLYWLRAAIRNASPGTEKATELEQAISDFTMEYTDAISTNAAYAYLAHRQLVADVAGEQQTHLLNILLDGFDESDGRVARILRSAGYLDSRQSFCVALAQPVEATEMLNPARARRLVDAIEEVLRGTSARRVVEIRDNHVTLIFSHARRASGWTAPRATLTGLRKADVLGIRLQDIQADGLYVEINKSRRLGGPVKKVLFEWTPELRLPHLARLTSLLVVGDPERGIVEFSNAGMVCLQRNDEGRWALLWSVVPALLG